MKNKNKIKLVLIFLVFMGLSNFSFGASVTQSTWDTLNNGLALIVDFISAIWYIFPILAGKLLGNDLVYGSFLHMDIILWKIWNFSKNLANFAIGFLFIFYLFRYLTSVSDKNVDIIKNTLPKIALGALLVNLSWFIIAVLIDISTILIAAAGSFASSMGNTFFQNTQNKKIAVVTQISISGCGSGDNNCIKFGPLQIKENTSKQKAISLKDVLKYEANISGPLLFMGMSILDINHILPDSSNQSYNNNSKQYYSKGATMKLFVRLLVLVLFFVPMVILIIVLLVRVFWLWIYIGFSPLIFLDQIFGGKVLGRKPAFKFSNIIGLIFQPAIIVLAFSVSFIFLLAVFVGLDSTTSDLNVKEQKFYKAFYLSGSSNGVINSTYLQVQDSTQTMSKYIGGFFGYMILVFLASAIVRGLLKIAFKSSEITANIAEASFNFTQDLLKSVRIIPTPWGRQSIGSLQVAAKKLQAYPSVEVGKQLRNLEERFNFKADIIPQKEKEYLDIIKKLTPGQSLSSLQKEELDEIFNQISKYSDDVSIIKYRSRLKNVLKALIEKVQSYNPADTKLLNLIDELKKESNFEEQVKIFVSHLDDFKKILSNDTNGGTN